MDTHNDFAGRDNEPVGEPEADTITATLSKVVWATIGLALADQHKRMHYIARKSHSLMASSAVGMAERSIEEALVELAGAMSDFIDFGKPTDADMQDGIDQGYTEVAAGIEAERALNERPN